jgi:PAS domain S-box-containing protein
MQDALISTRIDGEILNVNPSFLRLMSYEKPEELIGKNAAITIWLNADDRKKFREELLKNNVIHNKIICNYSRSFFLFFIKLGSY